MCILIFFKKCIIVRANIIPRLTSNILNRFRYNICLLLSWICKKYLASNNPHTSDEGYDYANYKDGKITHFSRFPRLRMLGTQRPTKRAWCLLTSESPRNQSVTLKTKLPKAANRK